MAPPSHLAQEDYRAAAAVKAQRQQLEAADALAAALRELDAAIAEERFAGGHSVGSGAVRPSTSLSKPNNRGAQRSLLLHAGVACASFGPPRAPPTEPCIFLVPSDAARLRDESGVGLLGWWVGRGEDDSTGHLMHISTDFGRYVGQVYSPKDIQDLMPVGWEWTLKK